MREGRGTHHEANDVVSEVCVEAHPGGEGKREVRSEAHEDAREEGADGRGGDQLPTNVLDALAVAPCEQLGLRLRCHAPSREMAWAQQ